MDQYRLGNIIDSYFQENPGRKIIEDMESSEEIVKPGTLPEKVLYDDNHKFLYAEFKIGNEVHCLYRNEDEDLEFSKMTMQIMEEDVKEKVFKMICTNIYAFDYESLILTDEKLNRKT